MIIIIEFSNSKLKTSESLWQYCRDISAVNNNENIAEFDGANASQNNWSNGP